MIITAVVLTTALLSFFAWSAIHELSHYLVASEIKEVEGVSFKVYPHINDKNNLVFASVTWAYAGDPLTPREDAFISIAPRVPDLLAVILIPLAAVMPMWLAVVWTVFFGAGLVDLAFGSIGTTYYSDLQRFVRGTNFNIWVVRAVGWTLALSSAAITSSLLATRSW